MNFSEQVARYFTKSSLHREQTSTSTECPQKWFSLQHWKVLWICYAFPSSPCL